ncbi:MAG: CotH kinase family protein [Clostridia bacterium]|nr:CotH kinase family protein [Clostridia bacterium]
MKKISIILTFVLCLLLMSVAASALEVELSHDSGFYADTVTLRITCDNPRAKIYYTLDGSEPDESSFVYEGPLSLVDSSTRVDVLTKITGTNSAENYITDTDFPTGRVVRAVAIAPNGERSVIASATYFVGYDRKELYGDTAIVCLVTDPDHLFDYETGIYVLGKVFDQWAPQQTEPFEDWQAQGNFSQRGKEWERPVSVTILASDGTSHTQDMGMRIKGGASRGFNQKSIRLIAREEYGDKNVNFPVFPQNVREADGGIVSKYKSFTLRSGANDMQFAKIRDPYITNLAEGMRVETAANMPVIAFINGEYWGVYTLNEEYTDKYIQYHYGIDDNNVIMIKVGELEEGEESDYDLFLAMYDFIAWEDMEDPDVYAQACQMLDMGSFADYWAIQFYVANEDGPDKNNNWQMWRVRVPEPGTHPYADGRWRMMLYDTDYSSGVYSDGDGADQDTISLVLYSDEYEEYNPALMFQNLMLNEEFRLEFIRACCDVRNVYFSSGRADAMLKKMRAEYEPYVPDSFRRFGPQWITWHPEGHYASKLDGLGRFFQRRSSAFSGTVKTSLDLGNVLGVNIRIRGEGEVYINNRNVPVPNNARLDLFPECGLTVTAVPAEGATFTGWEVSHDSAVVEDPTALTTTVTFSRVFTLTATFE